MALYALSDTHLSLEADKPMDVFGLRWKDHTDKIKEQWTKTVKDTDTVVIPGDISWAMTLEEARKDLLFLESLPGIKLISKGNHDYWWATLSKINNFFEENSIKTIKPLFNNAYIADGFALCASRGWYTDNHNAPQDADYTKIVSREVGRIQRSIDAADSLDPKLEKLLFLHFPPVFADYVCDEIVDCIIDNGIRRCYYGHIHGQYDIEPTKIYRNVEFNIISSDYLNFNPKEIN